MIGWALITIYMLFAAVFITVKGIENVSAAIKADGGKFTLNDVFANPIFRNIVISLVSTYGLYFISSLIFFDPAHMVTSFVQYLLVSSPDCLILHAPDSQKWHSSRLRIST